MSGDPEKREIDPAKDNVWQVDVSVSLDFPMYVVADSREEANEVGSAYWKEEFHESLYDLDADVSAAREPEKAPVKDLDWANSHPWGRHVFQGQELMVNQIIELIANPPPPPGPVFTYDTQTELMPFVDSPPPLRGTDA